MSNTQSLPLKFWGLDRWPFRGSVAAGQFYPTAGHNEALARIEYLVESGRRLGALMAGAGAGKSLLLKVARTQLMKKGAAVAIIDALGTTTREALWQLAVGLGTQPHDEADVAWLWRKIADRVTENRIQQTPTVVMVDDAGQAGPDLATQLARLVRLDTTSAAQWTLVFAAEPGQAARWPESLRSAVDLRIEIAPWSVDDTIGYVQTALVEGGRMEPVFEDGALRSLHELSAGIPREVARLADYALLAGAAARVESVSAAMIEESFDEIAWPMAAAAY
jgi:general secretion pathway protein A